MKGDYTGRSITLGVTGFKEKNDTLPTTLKNGSSHKGFGLLIIQRIMGDKMSASEMCPSSRE